MPLINLVIALIIVGVALSVIYQFISMQPNVKTLLNVVVVFAGIWMLQSGGLWADITNYRLPR
jgi:hypothetical protein